MTKEPDKSTCEERYNNKSLSGIEFRDKYGKLVNFIVIKHDEVLEKNRPYRTTIILDDKGKPILPPPRTFEEIIQAKRRQQTILYGSGTSSSATLSERTARRVAAAARQAVSAAAANLSRRPVATTSRGSTNPSRNTSRSKSRSRSRSRKKPRPVPLGSPERLPSTSKASIATTTATATTTPTATSTSTVEKEKTEPGQNDPKPSITGPANHVFTSLKDLNKYNSLFNSVDTKEVKLLLKSAPPGSCIVLPNGTVLKKSRRGGARAGAGRKRSRPYPPGQQSSASRNTNGSLPPQASSNSSFSSQA